MVFIQLDSGTFKEFTAPCEITIGRGENNVLQPESQSVSKAHATIHLAVDPLKTSIDAVLEDLNSRNGSFIGSSPLELSRVPKGAKAPLSFGDYIRFGHSQKLFRYLERIPPTPLPIAEQPLDEEDELQVLPTEQQGTTLQNGTKKESGIKRDEYDFELVNSGMMTSKRTGLGSQSSIYPARDWVSDSNRNLDIGPAVLYGNDDDDDNIPRIRVDPVKIPLREPSSQQVLRIVSELRGGREVGRDLKQRTTSQEVELSVSLLSECLAESLNDQFALTSTGRMNRIMMDVNSLLSQCMRGTTLPISSTSPTGDQSTELDRMLSEAIVGVLESTLSRLHELSNTGLVSAMSAGDAGENSKLAHLSMQHSSADLKALYHFVTRDITTTRLWKDLQPGLFYEVIAHMLSGVLDQLDVSSEVIWGIKAKSDSATKDHVLQQTHPESVLPLPQSSAVHKSPKSSLSLELEELRRYKREAEVRQQSETLKMQDNAKDIALLRIRRLLAVLSAYFLRKAWWKWKSRRKRDTLFHKIIKARSQQWKKMAWSRWSDASTSVKLKQKNLKRAVRIIAGHCEQRLRTLFFRWWRTINIVSFEPNLEETPPEDPVRDSISTVKNDKDAEIARLKYEVINLKAALHEASKEKELPGLLAAERALTREISAENVQLRALSQSLDSKLLEMVQCPQKKRRDLVYRHLVAKEDELMATKQYLDTLTAELDRIQQLHSQRMLADEQQPVAADSTLPEIAVRGRSTEKRRSKNQSHPEDRPDSQGAAANRMSQDTARIVILSEVRRLRDSHRAAEEALQMLQSKVLSEAAKSAQVSLALSATQSRLRSLERSSAALRELLRQRVGDSGVLHLIEALENVGAGPAALLEVSSSSHNGIPHHNRDQFQREINSQRYGDDNDGYYDDPQARRSRNNNKADSSSSSSSNKRNGNNNAVNNFSAQRIPTEFSFAVENALYF